MPGATQPRDVVGRFSGALRTPPEMTLGAPLLPGDRVAYGSVHGCRVIEVAGDVLTLRPPRGGRLMAKLSEVTSLPETPEQRQRNLSLEADVARLLASVKKLSRQRREDMGRPTNGAREALDALAMLHAEGRLDLERYVYAMRSTEDAPLAANHAALALAMRHALDVRHYTALTDAARRAGAVLPD